MRSTNCLKKKIGNANLSYNELLATVTEVEAVINSRPLSYVTPDDLEEPLTPSHFLNGRHLLNLPKLRKLTRILEDLLSIEQEDCPILTRFWMDFGKGGGKNI